MAREMSTLDAENFIDLLSQDAVQIVKVELKDYELNEDAELHCTFVVQICRPIIEVSLTIIPSTDAKSSSGDQGE